MRTLLLFSVVCCAALNALQADNLIPPPMPPAQAKMYDRITSRVIAPCCWSQPVQTHQSEAAEKVRGEIITYLAQGIGEPEILDRLAAEYGERILGEPRGISGTVAMMTPYLFLLSGLAVCAVVLARLVRRRRVASFAGPLPDISDFEL